MLKMLINFTLEQKMVLPRADRALQVRNQSDREGNILDTIFRKFYQYYSTKKNVETFCWWTSS